MPWALSKSILLLAAGCCVLSPTLNSENVPGSDARAVILRETVFIQQSRIRFSDLLPAQADNQLRQSAAALNLGRTPEPGSFRVFTAEELRHNGGSKLQVRIPEMVVVHSAGFPIEVAALKRALAEYKGPEGLGNVAISFPLEVVTRAPNPRFRVVSLQVSTDSHLATAIMKCQMPSDCRPFVVQLAFLEPVRRLSSEKQKLRVKADPIKVGTALVRTGRPALLALNDAGLRISLPVFPLSRASMGERVRVQDKVSRRIYRAHVSGQNQLVADLEEQR